MVRMGVRSARLRWTAPKVQAARPGAAQVYSRSREKWKRATRSEQVLSCKLDAAQRSEVPVDDRAPLAVLWKMLDPFIPEQLPSLGTNPYLGNKSPRTSVMRGGPNAIPSQLSKWRFT